ncbi:MAG: arginase [Desulfuromonas sp.]|nr:MAG: arginase [Desulfuromonas sp.]
MDKTIRIIGVPMDLGQAHRGVDLGPGAVRYAGLSARLRALGYRIHDRGNLPVPVRDSLPADEQEPFLSAISRVCADVYQAGCEAVADGCLPIFLGGDHSISIGTIGGVTDHEPCGVIWVDAHGDFNTPRTSRSGNIHGMPLATLLGSGFDELVDVGRLGAKITLRDVVMIGIRDLDAAERERLRLSGINIFTMRDIDELGMAQVTRAALELLGHHRRLHVSLDLDGLDPHEAPGVGTPSPGGLTYREAQLLMEIIADTGKVSSADLVEINPILDHANSTARMAVDLAVSLFGKRIL